MRTTVKTSVERAGLFSQERGSFARDSRSYLCLLSLVLVKRQLQERDQRLERCASIFDSQKVEFDKLAALNKDLLERYQALKQE